MKDCEPIPGPVMDALGVIMDRLAGMREIWALTGSLSLRLQGVSLNVQDIDLQTTRAGAYAIERRFQHAVLQPVAFSEGAQMRSHFGRLATGEVVVEIMGDLQKRLPDGAWSPAPNLGELLSGVSWRGHTIPVLELTYELKAYRMLGRERTAERIAQRLELQQERFAKGGMMSKSPDESRRLSRRENISLRMSSERGDLSIQVISPEDTFALRISVLRPHISGEELRFPGDEEPSTIHLGAFLDDALVGVTTAIREPPPDGANGGAWRLRGVAVDPEYQGSGYGWELMNACERRIRAAGGVTMWCNARVGVISFYQKLGFQVVSEEFEIPKIGPHVEMRKRLSPTKP
jgi:GNAT superfamily N-acetyltransferase